MGTGWRLVGLGTVLAGLAGCPWFAKVLPTPVVSPARVAYLENCSLCHGADGLGDGSAAAQLPVAPADFSSGVFKLRSTPSGQLPTDDDLFTTITRGIGGSGMPSFAHLPEETRRMLVAEVKRLSRPRDGGESYFETRPPKRTVEVPPRPPVTVETIARGRKVYENLECGSCHGKEGRGDGSAADELVDWAKRPLRPTDFTLGVYMSGADPAAIYLRIATGLNGTPMPEYGNDLIGADDRWALVAYLLSLAGR